LWHRNYVKENLIFFTHPGGTNDRQTMCNSGGGMITMTTPLPEALREKQEDLEERLLQAFRKDPPKGMKATMALLSSCITKDDAALIVRLTLYGQDPVVRVLRRVTPVPKGKKQA
jgi:hypothetical protein